MSTGAWSKSCSRNSSDVALLLPPGQIALHDAARELGAACVERNAFGQLRHLVHEADPVHAPVVFDERKRGNAAALANGQVRFLKRRDSAALVGRIEEIDVVAINVGGGLPIRHDEELLVLTGALAQDSPGELQSHVQIR